MGSPLTPSFRRINLEVIPHHLQRYDTPGDYWIDPDGTWQIRVSDQGDWRYNFTVLLHELVELALTQRHGISEESITEFDKAVESGSKYADDPGFDPAAPYHWEHVMADTIERMVSTQLEFEIMDQWEAVKKLPKW